MSPCDLELQIQVKTVEVSIHDARRTVARNEIDNGDAEVRSYKRDGARHGISEVLTIGNKAGGATSLEHCIVELMMGVVGRKDEGFSGELTDANMPTCSQAVSGWQGEYPLRRVKVSSLKARIQDLGVGADQVEHAQVKLLDKSVDEQFPKNKAHLGIAFAVKADALVKGCHNRGCDVTNGERAAFSASSALGGSMGLLHGLKHLHGFVVEDASGCGEVNAATGALEELDVQFAL